MAQKVSASVNAGATLTQDVAVGGSEFLVVTGRVGNAGSAATAAGDVVISVQPYMDDEKSDSSGGTLSDALAPALETGTAVLANSTAQQVVRYRVSGWRKVQVVVKNNNAAAKPVTIDFGIG
jgi:hypothetical protein